ncbi:hypothetical protein LMJ53_12795 [Rheinheimera sp. UJ51]|uniref:hypothetical protein n=1 Tax=Rheinheimera sp. UJ51 TaxID=2892446 RepID=UPI001E2AB927|nr:hypothetical protein [Rheinheimera sp. UJ51]MCC5452599.1 hypothetical protein [Rheinheimera sp. UJ51]
MRCLLIIFSLAIFTGCATSPALTTSDTMQIIQAAADSAPAGVYGKYTLLIQSTGTQIGDDRIFLNTELDYRDQRNITIALSHDAVKELNDHTGQAAIELFKGKQIQVIGDANRVRIDFTSRGQPTGKYYYQTHIRVTQASQIKVL